MPHDKDEFDFAYTGVPDANNIISVEVIQPSTLETIDYAFYDFMNESMNLRANTLHFGYVKATNSSHNTWFKTYAK